MTTLEKLANGFGFTAIVLLLSAFVMGMIADTRIPRASQAQKACAWTVFALAIACGLAGIWLGVASA